MKIILSIAGGGKTTKVAELVAKYTLEGTNIHIISGGITAKDFRGYLQEVNIDNDRIRFSEMNNLVEIVETIENDTVSEVFFIDEYINLYNVDDENIPYQDTMKKLLSEFQRYEKENNKKLYVTQQTNYADPRLTGGSLVILGY